MCPYVFSYINISSSQHYNAVVQMFSSTNILVEEYNMNNFEFQEQQNFPLSLNADEAKQTAIDAQEPIEQVQQALPGNTTKEEQSQAIKDTQKADPGTTGKQEAADIIKAKLDYNVDLPKKEPVQEPHDMNYFNSIAYANKSDADKEAAEAKQLGLSQMQDADGNYYFDKAPDSISEKRNEIYNLMDKDSKSITDHTLKSDTEAIQAANALDMNDSNYWNKLDEITNKQASDKEANENKITQLKKEIRQDQHANNVAADEKLTNDVLNNADAATYLNSGEKDPEADPNASSQQVVKQMTELKYKPVAALALLQRDAFKLTDEELKAIKKGNKSGKIKYAINTELKFRKDPTYNDYTKTMFEKPSKDLDDSKLNIIKDFWEKAKPTKDENKKKQKAALKRVNAILDERSTDEYLNSDEQAQPIDIEQPVEEAPIDDTNAEAPVEEKDNEKKPRKLIGKKAIAKAKGVLGKLFGSNDSGTQIDYSLDNSGISSVGGGGVSSGVANIPSVPHYEDDTSSLTSSNIEKPNKYDWHNTSKTSFSGRMGIAAAMAQLAKKASSGGTSASETPHYEDIDNGQVDQTFEQQDTGPEAKFVKATKGSSSSPMAKEVKQGKISISNGSLLASLIQKIQRVYKTWDESQGRYYKKVNDDIKISTADGISVLVNGKSLANIDEATQKVINSAL